MERVAGREIPESTNSALPVLALGLVVVVVPPEASTETSLLPAGRVWLKAAVTAAAQGMPDLVAVVADSSKVGRRAFARICAAAEVDVLVTDAGITAAAAARFAEAGTRVITD